ncbi:putative acyltransferase (DUF342 family) [Methanohalophilus levihalophilus]|uniref:polymer-forming cytoskeletal protein n=1 Tax=Methanohalophilus levihalophilus TaxID=1431282 RepID=UPI001AE7A404|nr:polymer-forming cytoskeletal protein [Methanohalophilus levihalophilus]MBP2030201.1 putative acyltransferase (DUF342 family) [Methanohalophilus levihalophilus]
MEDNFLKYHPESNTYIAEKRSYFKDEIRVDGNLIAGALSNFWKSLSATGTVELGKRTIVRGDLKATRILLGPGSEITGNLHAEDEAILLDGAIIGGSATCGGQMKIRPGCKIKFAKADRELELVGKVHIGEIESGTRVVVRSD